MADVVLLGCLFTFLLINTGYAGLPGLLEGDSTSENAGAADNQLLNEPASINKLMVQQPRYKCHQCEPPDCAPDRGGAHCGSALYCYKSAVRGADGELQLSRGCSRHYEHYQLTCWTGRQGSMLRKRHVGQVNISCCQGDMCNHGAFPELPPLDTAIEPIPSSGWKLWAAVSAAALAVGALAAAAVRALRRDHKLRVSRAALNKLGESSYFQPNMYSQHVTSAYYEGVDGSSAAGTNSGGLRARCAGDSTLREYLEQSATSGSGAGLPLMVQRTLAKQVALHARVGKGRFGEVWRGLWYADDVAVKIFFSRDEASWRRETEIYSTVLLRHDNILAYIGSDMTSQNSCTQLWLITHYHPLGSLYEHLARAPLTRQQMMLVCVSVVSGLLHLHTEIHGTQGKPAIAHRDIKSKNILMKSDGSCCIADFGLAVTAAHVAAAAPARQGTVRYMSPELLDNSMNAECFESYRKCDIYALALVLWEVTARAGPRPRPAVPPYHPLVGQDPGQDEMRKIVCTDAARPELPDTAQPTMAGLNQLIRECWHANPSVRLPALRIKKTLLKLALQDNSIHLDQDSDVHV
ncbi:hypothetical protein JYU34_014909 [Plutella xylostella]|uniref:receptor protein serine/threonine kinase n=1 Tax=Plutella xylostella TaxID=51655 RepID=A0ABQ7Q607_PLUXY|nr:hypothetical protein JYU34_014909 [Plutella xylostella]